MMTIGPAMHPQPGSESEVAANTPGEPDPSASRTAVRYSRVASSSSSNRYVVAICAPNRVDSRKVQSRKVRAGVKSGLATFDLPTHDFPGQPTIWCGTNRLVFRVTSESSSRMPMPHASPLTTQLPITG